ncbi:MAG: hypothetical protein ACOZE5_18660 [Verrucomicrobiota bacterium]
MEALQHHQELCNEIHQLALEENRFLQQHRRAPDAALLERKKSLLARLEETLAALRAVPRHRAEGAAFRAALDKTRARILQILQLDRENEQLLLRFSLAGVCVNAAPAAATPPSASLLQRIYQRHG